MEMTKIRRQPSLDKQTKPDVAIGHMGLAVPDLHAATDFFRLIGTRIVVSMPSMVIAELRGGTHVILRSSQSSHSSGHVPFDLMVDDIDAMRMRLIKAGYTPSSIQSGGVHRSFSVVDKSGMEFAFTSSHAMGEV